VSGRYGKAMPPGPNWFKRPRDFARSVLPAVATMAACLELPLMARNGPASRADECPLSRCQLNRSMQHRR
jgi:hypothetical protein